MSSLREELLAGIRSHREQFEAAGDRAEELRTLPNDAVATLRALGLFWVKTPAELGGTPLAPVEFSDVIEELAYIDTSTAWAAMIGAGCNGLAGGWLPEAGARRIFGPATGSGGPTAGGPVSGGRPLPVIAGQLAPRGTGAPTAGGYLVHGRWAFSSGIVHADWLIGAFKADGVVGGAGSADETDGGPAGTGFGRMIVFAVPKAEAEVIDNWHVAGLQGTGSLDFSLDGTFVPAELTYELGSPAVRGGELFRLGMPAFVSNEVPPLAIGLARRAIDDITELAAHTARFPGGPTVSERAVFHHELGRAEVRVRAARAVHREAMAAAFSSAVAGRAPSEDQQLAITTASVYAVETCADVVSELFKFGGGRALALSNPMQRHLRNVLAARQHVALSEENYEAAGRYLLESAKARRA
ncbi:MAG TPA: acyl-CoA dehydrogenase family protein [Trebonia sp.]|jgi:alkylation response protein AidB-like acyl-CoA dehydrogenase|nr:acyl-CoA dehydrogenase family protein [Trebonia sp.]